MNENAWLIWNGIDDGCPSYGSTYICLDETDALETYIALVEEEAYETFICITQDRYEDVDQDWEERAQWLNLWDTCWYIMEVPVIHGDPCSEELSEPTCG